MSESSGAELPRVFSTKTPSKRDGRKIINKFLLTKVKAVEVNID